MINLRYFRSERVDSRVSYAVSWQDVMRVCRPKVELISPVSPTSASGASHQRAEPGGRLFTGNRAISRITILWRLGKHI